jgi:hypothetical protein
VVFLGLGGGVGAAVAGGGDATTGGGVQRGGGGGGVTVGSDVAEMTGMPVLDEADGAPEATGGAVAVAAWLAGAAGAMAVVGGCAAVAGGAGLLLNIVNDTIVAPAATAAMSATIATTPLRDLGACASDVSSDAEPSVAYDSEPGAGGSDTRGVSFAIISPGGRGRGTSGLVRSNGKEADEEEEGGAAR